MHDIRNSYLLHIDPSGGETDFELQGCLAARAPVVWPGHGLILVPCFGTFSGVNGSPAGDGEVIGFDASSGQVVQTWPGGSPEQVVIVGDSALVGDAAGTGAMSIDLLTGQITRGVQNEAAICPQYGVRTIALANANQGEVAVLSCFGTNQTTPAFGIDRTGQSTGSSYSIPAGHADALSLFGATQETFATYSTYCCDTDIDFFTPPSAFVQVDVGVRLTERLSTLAVSDNSAFVIGLNTSSQEMLVQVRDDGAGPHLQGSLVAGMSTLGVFATASNEAWLMYSDHLARVRFP